MPADRRRHERFPLHVAATLRAEGATGRGEIVDLSPGGLRVKRIDDVPAAGAARVTLEVRAGRTATASGRVAWTSGRGVGIEFQHVSPEMRAFVDELRRVSPVLRTALVKQIRGADVQFSG
ncbi:MAG: PilZ domain-containing protein [Deltaproteobacteria bacterium]|nr:MAG: PilZ domain-containing protein [Deltaproteobacteria bacterium]